MSRTRWHIEATGTRYTLARHWPPRFDVSAVSAFPPVRADRLAQQVRQDLWRRLKALRGFSPVIQVDAAEGGVSLRAGGRVMACPPGTEDLIQSLLDSPAHRARWMAWAKVRG